MAIVRTRFGSMTTLSASGLGSRDARASGANRAWRHRPIGSPLCSASPVAFELLMPCTPSYGRIATTYGTTIPAVTSHPVFKFFPRVKNNLQPAPKVTDIYIPFAPFRMQSLFGIESWRENFVPADYGGHSWHAQ